MGTTAEKRAQFQALRLEVDVHASLATARRDLADVEERLATQSALLRVRGESLHEMSGETAGALAGKQRELEEVARQLAGQRSRLAAAQRERRDAEAEAADAAKALERDTAQLETLRAAVRRTHCTTK